MVKWASNIST
jgi:hypothetical protein